MPDVSLYGKLLSTEKMQKEQKPKIQTLEQENADLFYTQMIIEADNADLWYQNMISESKLEEANTEIALMWYEIMTGGADNVVQ